MIAPGANESFTLSLESAWKSYAEGDLPGALLVIQAASAQFPDEPMLRAALIWFLMESGAIVDAGETLAAALKKHPECAVLHWYGGILYQRRGDLNRAIEALREALTLDPTLDEATEALAWILRETGRLDDALHAAEQAHALKPTPSRLALQGKLILERGQPTEAVLRLLEACLSGADTTSLRTDFATALAQSGAEESLALYLPELLERPENRAQLLESLAWHFRSKGGYDAARLLIDRLVVTFPDHIMGWLLAGVIARETGKFVQAESYLSEAIRRDRTFPDAHLNLAFVQRQVGKLDAAIGTLEPLLGETPHATALSLKAQIHLEQQRPDLARPALHRLLHLQPSDWAAWNLLANCLWLARRYRIACHALRRALRLSPDNAPLWRQLAAWRIEQNLHEPALDAIDRALALDRDDTETLLLAAHCYGSAQQLEQAVTYSKRAAELAPENHIAWDTLAQHSFRLGRIGDAEAALVQLHNCPSASGPSSAQGKAHWLRERGLIGVLRAAYQRAAMPLPDDPDIALAMAEHECRAGHYDMAMTSANTALTRRPAWQDALALRNDILARSIDQQIRRDWQSLTGDGKSPFYPCPPRPQIWAKLLFCGSDSRPSTLVVTEAGKIRSDAALRRRLEFLLLAMRGRQTTLIVANSVAKDWQEIVPAIPHSVEVILEPSPERLSTFLQQAADYYDTILLTGLASLESIATDLRQHAAHKARVVIDSSANTHLPGADARFDHPTPLNAHDCPDFDASLVGVLDGRIAPPDLGDPSTNPVQSHYSAGSIRLSASSSGNVDIMQLHCLPPRPSLASEDYPYSLCTLCTVSHLFLARTLIGSIRQFFSGPVYLLLIDSEDIALIPPGTQSIRRDELINTREWQELQGRYNILEQCCALKPLLLRHVFQKSGHPVFYLDADTVLLAPLRAVLPRNPDFSAFLTPHLLQARESASRAYEVFILRVGAYNAGVVGVGCHPDAGIFLDWWADRSLHFAFDAMERGVYTDQKWLDLVPSMFAGVHISQNDGLNLGHWRVQHESDFSEDAAGRLTYRGEVVTLMHMSGFNSASFRHLAKHLETPITRPALLRHLETYAQLLSSARS